VGCRRQIGRNRARRRPRPQISHPAQHRLRQIQLHRVGRPPALHTLHREGHEAVSLRHRCHRPHRPRRPVAGDDLPVRAHRWCRRPHQPRGRRRLQVRETRSGAGDFAADHHRHDPDVSLPAPRNRKQRELEGALLRHHRRRGPLIPKRLDRAEIEGSARDRRWRGRRKRTFLRGHDRGRSGVAPSQLRTIGSRRETDATAPRCRVPKLRTQPGQGRE